MFSPLLSSAGELYWWGLPVIVVLGLGMIIADQFVSYFALRGAAGGGVNLIPVLYLLSIYLVGTVWLLVLSNNVNNEANR